VPQAKSNRYSLVAGEPVADAEAVFQNVVDRSHDEIHDRRRRVIDPPAFARILVVRLQVILVEIDERIALKQPVFLLVRGAHLAADRFALAERQVLVDRRQVQSVDNGEHLFDDPAHVAVFLLVQLIEEIDQFADETE
jgi:hypothetical protein